MVHEVCLILLSGGLGKRFSAKLPKQFYEINGTSYTKSTGTGNSKTFTFLA